MAHRLQQQADDLYRRGVAAARGGQKTMAATLLRQAVKLNPQHEQAWLWLSGVLDKPQDVAFCLRAVLGINPENERARRGLAALEQQAGAEAIRTPGTGLSTSAAADTWWSTWRASQSTWLWTFRALLLIPIVLLGATMALRALIESQPLPTFSSYQAAIPTPRPTLEPMPTGTPVTTPTPTSHDMLTAYFEKIGVERAALRQASATYRTISDSGRTTVERTTATKALRDQVQQSRERLTLVPPPPEVAAAHRLYIEGLTWEQEALDLVLEFYGSYEPSLANQAALRMQDARNQIGTATATWDAFARQQGLTTEATPTP